METNAFVSAPRPLVCWTTWTSQDAGNGRITAAGERDARGTAAGNAISAAKGAATDAASAVPEAADHDVANHAAHDAATASAAATVGDERQWHHGTAPDVHEQSQWHGEHGILPLTVRGGKFYFY